MAVPPGSIPFPVAAHQVLSGVTEISCHGLSEREFAELLGGHFCAWSRALPGYTRLLMALYEWLFNSSGGYG